VHGLVDERVRDELERLPSVRLHGAYGPADLGRILDEVDVGLIPSIWEEVYPHAGLEFLAKGVPLIANARGGLPECTIPGETGWLNRSCTGAELAEIMTDVIREPDQVVRLNRSIRDRRDDLIKPLEQHLQELDELYHEAAAGRRARGAQPASTGR
jgi:glycosyltransferase involved in cell wall biosynthesis